jgi:hypothetical protein
MVLEVSDLESSTLRARGGGIVVRAGDSQGAACNGGNVEGRGVSSEEGVQVASELALRALERSRWRGRR